MNRRCINSLLVGIAFLSGLGGLYMVDTDSNTTFTATNLKDHSPVFQVNILTSMGLRQGEFAVAPFVFMANHLSVETKKRIFYLLCEGNGIRSISRLTGCHVRTISELQKRYCHIIEYLNRKHITDLSVDEIEADELRTFVRHAGNIRWIYVALDRKSRMILHFHIGKRDTTDSKIFLTGLSYKLNEKSKVSTDCLASYVSAVARTPNGRIEAATNSIGLLRANDPDKKLKRSITNRIETHNGNIRQHVSRLTRKTRCFSKKEEGLRQHLTLFFFYYNFIKRHKSLKTTPAVAIGVTDEAFWENKLLEYDILFTETTKAADKNYYGLVELPTKVVSIGREESDDFTNELKEMFSVKNKNRGIYKPRKNIHHVIQIAS